MKLANAVPIFKQGSRFTCSNYRPISVLSSISKVFEKCIYNQVMFYFMDGNMISSKPNMDSGQGLQPLIV